MRPEAQPTLFVRAGALGDFVLSLPVLRALASIGPVHVVTTPRYAPLLPRGATLVSGDWLWQGGPPPAAYRLAVAFSPTAADALRAAGVPNVLAVAPCPPPGVHAVDHFASVLEGAAIDGLGAVDCTPRVDVPPFVGAERPIVLAPGSGGATKRWPIERWRAVADLLDVPPVWVRGPVEAGEDWPIHAVSPDLEGLVALAASCRAWLGPDAGPSHLAAAVGAPVGVVFGVTDATSWAPVGARVFPWETEPTALASWASFFETRTQPVAHRPTWVR